MITAVGKMIQELKTIANLLREDLYDMLRDGDFMESSACIYLSGGVYYDLAH